MRRQHGDLKTCLLSFRKRIRLRMATVILRYRGTERGGGAENEDWGVTTCLTTPWYRHRHKKHWKRLPTSWYIYIYIYICRLLSFYCSCKIDRLTYRTRVSLPILPLGDSTDLTMNCPDNGGIVEGNFNFNPSHTSWVDVFIKVFFFLNFLFRNGEHFYNE